MNDDLISRSQLYSLESLLMTDIVANNPMAKFVLEQVLYDIENIESADVAEVAHGRWEPRTDVTGFVRCSVCHDCNIYDDWAGGKKWNYCPNCGADMRERKEE